MILSHRPSTSTGPDSGGLHPTRPTQSLRPNRNFYFAGNRIACSLFETFDCFCSWGVQTSTRPLTCNQRLLTTIGLSCMKTPEQMSFTWFLQSLNALQQIDDFFFLCRSDWMHTATGEASRSTTPPLSHMTWHHADLFLFSHMQRKKLNLFRSECCLVQT